jgi:hypothetical protein
MFDKALAAATLFQMASCVQLLCCWPEAGPLKFGLRQWPLFVVRSGSFTNQVVGQLGGLDNWNVVSSSLGLGMLAVMLALALTFTFALSAMAR